MKINSNIFLLRSVNSTNIKALFIFVLLFLFSYTITADIKPSSKVISNYLNLSINVKTNVDCFTCDFQSEVDDTIGLAVSLENNIYNIEGGQYIIPVKLIDCHNSIMNNDLQDMFRVSEYPHILIKINKLNIDKDEGSKGEGILLLNIDGINKLYPISFTNYIKKDDFVINGNMSIDLNDFSIKPPTKFFGLITVDKVININFGLRMKVIQI
jgi:hypothetical protein